MNKLQLVKSENFGNITCDIYQNDNEFYMTREQIGQALEYANPQKALDTLHARNKQRLDKFSDTLKLRGTDGKSYDTTVYDRKGIMEICRHSNQPKANAFMDFAWEIMDRLMSGNLHLQNMPQTLPEALRLAADLAEKAVLLQGQVEEQRPKVLFADSVETAQNSILIGDLAKIIRQNGVEMGQNRLFDWLRDNSFLCKFGERYNAPTQSAMDMGLFEVKVRTINNPDGSIRTTKTTKVTGKGQIYFVNKFVGAGFALAR